jgi:hypothetical protein
VAPNKLGEAASSFELPLGKGEVDSSILSCSTIFSMGYVASKLTAGDAGKQRSPQSGRY